MASVDPGDVVYVPNSANPQSLGDAIVQNGGVAAGVNFGLVLTTVRKSGPGYQGIYNKYHARNHVDFFEVNVYPS